MISTPNNLPEPTLALYSNLKSILNSDGQDDQRSIPINQCLQLSLRLIDQQYSKEQIMINTYQSVTHLLDNLLLLQGIIESKDKKLLSKAFQYFHNHLISLVHNLHQYPMCASNNPKKSNFMQRHLEIMNDFQLKDSKGNTPKDLSFDDSRISRIYENRQYSVNHYDTRGNSNIRVELEEAKMIIEDLNKYYEEEISTLKRAKENIQRHFEAEKLKFINIIEDLEVETVRLKYQKLRDEMAINELRGEIRQMTGYKNHDRQLSTGEFGYLNE